MQLPRHRSSQVVLKVQAHFKYGLVPLIIVTREVATALDHTARLQVPSPGQAFGMDQVLPNMANLRSISCLDGVVPSEMHGLK